MPHKENLTIYLYINILYKQRNLGGKENIVRFTYLHTLTQVLVF